MRHRAQTAYIRRKKVAALPLNLRLRRHYHCIKNGHVGVTIVRQGCLGAFEACTNYPLCKWKKGL